MALFKTANPALQANTFSSVPKAADSENRMTLGGTSNKTAFLLGLLLIAGAYAWRSYIPPKTQFDHSPGIALAMYGSIIAAIFIGSFITFKPRTAPFLAWLFALCEGYAMGVISRAFDSTYPGIVGESIFLTLFVFAVLLIIYKLGLIEVSENIKLIIVSATASIFAYYVAVFILGLYGIDVPVFHSSGMFAIVVSIIVVAIAALNLVLDLDFIEQGVALGAPKYMEWYGAFGLMVTLIWLYFEVLRTLGKLCRK
jgi:uncharacterized YccA/Bax inhibitor family protein